MPYASFLSLSLSLFLCLHVSLAYTEKIAVIDLPFLEIHLIFMIIIFSLYPCYPVGSTFSVFFTDCSSSTYQ